jgi:hypothetical protein
MNTPKPCKLIIAGGRDFFDYNVFEKHVSLLTSNIEVDEIVNGGAKGADELGRWYAKKNNIPLKIFYAKWIALGKKAGPIRNEEMAQYATHAIIFWDGNSRGSKSMIDMCKKYNIAYRVVRI